ncbi:MAG: cytochrome C [Bacteroidetes bacterium]|nr:MAG: cytochrome C [Bacteroidota bacterium]
MIKKILLAFVVLFIIIQFFRPAKNISGDTTYDISTLYHVPENVNTLLKRSCNDCHSNMTQYPWYAHIQPVGWWLNNHIEEGKRHFNVNTFASYPAAMQKKRLEDCMEQLEHDEMPLGSYTLIHTYARLSEADKQILHEWCSATIDTIKSRFPPDSLVLKKRNRD